LQVCRAICIAASRQRWLICQNQTRNAIISSVVSGAMIQVDSIACCLLVILHTLINIRIKGE